MTRKSCFSIVGSCALLALLTGLALAVILAGASVALADHQRPEQLAEGSGSTIPNQLSLSGMITDSRCGARHIRGSDLSSGECARACVRKGASYVLVDGERRYALSGDEEILARLAGARTNVSGIRQGETIVVGSATPIF